MLITWERLKELLNYCLSTGVFTWRVTVGKRAKVGSVAGCVNCVSGYITIRIDGKAYQAHRLAWLYVHGEWPKNHIDHINSDNNPEAINRADNRIVNLREATNRENCSNKRIHREGHLVGTTLFKERGKWQSKICINGKHTHLGLFPSELEAHEAYLNKLNELKGIE